MKSKLLKNVYATIVALFIAMFALPTEMQAQQFYAIRIAGVPITSQNYNDLSKIGGVSGTVKYDPTAIETPIADNRAAEGIYTLSGVRLSGELKDLPKGIYIVNGKKVVKQ